jgi:hypothetical protein
MALAFAGFLATAQAQTGPALVPKWTNTTVFGNQASVNGGAFNPVTGHLLVCQALSTPASIVICRSSDGASVGTLNTTGVSGGTYALSGLAIDASGVIYASSYASGGCSLYSWANESAAPVNFANPGGGAGNIGQTMAGFGTGTNAVFILSSSFVPLYACYDGANWLSKELNVGSGTVQGGISIISWSPSNCVFITKNSSGAGNYNTFDPGDSSPIAVTQTAYTSSPLAAGIPGPVQGAGGYDPATGLFGFHSRASVTNTINNYLVLTTSNTLAAPGGCSPVVSTVVVQTSGADSVNGFGADFWGNGVFYSVPAQLASKGFGFRAYDVTAFKVSDISPAAATKNAGDSVTFSVVSGGSGLSYQWWAIRHTNDMGVASGPEYSGTYSNQLTISPIGTNDAGGYMCSVSGVSSSHWGSSLGYLTVVPPPAVPTGLGATGGYEQISLSWNASANATSYKVYRWSSGTATNLVGSPTTTNYTDRSGLSDGTTYFYAVTGVNISGESAASGAVSAQTALAAPASPVATAGNGQVILSWTASTGATGYDIYISTTSGNETYLTTVTGTSYTNLNLADAPYYYVITAVGASGQSLGSTEVSTIPYFPTTINGTNHYAYGANLGWVDWRGDATHGAVIGTNVCSGYIYSANFGWISLGNGSPANGLHYQNNSASDFGVNVDSSGNLSGYAYGANIGWINFTNPGTPKVDLASGSLSGSVWSANWGWISLSNTVASVQTSALQQSSPPVTAPKLGGLAFASGGGGGFGFSFTNVPGASSSFTVWATTNLTQPFSNWTWLGHPTEAPSGFYQFTDPQADNNVQRFYRVSSP